MKPHRFHYPPRFAIKTIADLIRLFESIPEEEWCTGIRQNNEGNARCALGHYGAFTRRGTWLFMCPDNLLGISAGELTSANNNQSDRFPQPTPRARVLAFLRSRLATP